MADTFQIKKSIKKLIHNPIHGIASIRRHIVNRKTILNKNLKRDEKEESLLIDDPLLVFRGNPHYPDHDRNGYRNKKVPHSVHTLAVGDSQVYGITVLREQSWPYRLEKFTRLKVYNVSIGGWGVPQFGMAMEQQLSLRPQNVLIGIYTGQSVYRSLIYINKSASTYAKSYWRPSYASLPLQDFSYIDDHKNKIIANLLETNLDCSRAQALAICASRGIQDCNYVQIGNEKFYLEDTYRFLIQDLEHPAVNAALQISKEALFRMKASTRLSGAKLSVVLIPTKEYLVYLRRDDALVENINTLVRLGGAEQKLINDLKGFCIEEGIHCYDLSNILARHLDEGIYWRNSDDGHPTALGCRYIAAYLAENIFGSIVKR